MARSYNTIPAHEDDAPKQTKSWKGLVAGTALAAFALGVLAVTAVRAPAATPLANLSKDGSKCTCNADTSKTYTDLKACLDQCHDRRASKTSRLTITLGAGDFSLEEQYKIPMYTTIEGTIKVKAFASYVFAAKPNPHGNDWGTSPGNEQLPDEEDRFRTLEGCRPLRRPLSVVHHPGLHERRVEVRWDGETGLVLWRQAGPGEPCLHRRRRIPPQGKEAFLRVLVHPFNCEAGAGYNKDMKMWQCLDDS